MAFKKGDRVRIVDISKKSYYYQHREVFIGSEAVIGTVFEYTNYREWGLKDGYLVAELAFFEPLKNPIHGDQRGSMVIFGVKLEHVSTYTPEQLAEWDAYDMEVES